MPAYLDHNASTHLDPRVLDAMLPYLSGPYGNASSLHRFGRAARDAVERARVQVAALVGAQPGEVVWTSGGTESNNLAIKGVAALAQGRVLYGATEHPAVMEAAAALSAGRGVEPIAVDHDGLVDWSRLEQQLAAGPVALVALMRANNETGVIQDVARAARLVHGVDAYLHVDAVQAAGKIALDFAALDADLMSLSSHKLYGPKGVGALVRRSEVDLWPLHHGGPQEKGRPNSHSRNGRRGRSTRRRCAIALRPACKRCPAYASSVEPSSACPTPFSSPCPASRARLC
jgi:cysteine desulfurase